MADNQWAERAAKLICESLAEGTIESMRRVGFEWENESSFMDSMRDTTKDAIRIIESCAASEIAVLEKALEMAIEQGMKQVRKARVGSCLFYGEDCPFKERQCEDVRQCAIDYFMAKAREDG